MLKKDFIKFLKTIENLLKVTEKSKDSQDVTKSLSYIVLKYASTPNKA